jgi:hypothetical protein
LTVKYSTPPGASTRAIGATDSTSARAARAFLVM